MSSRRRWIAFTAIGGVVSVGSACSLFVDLDGLQSSAPGTEQQQDGSLDASGGDAGTGCDAGFATCGSSCGTDIANDPQNCGTCGHVCGSENTTTVACAAGKCVFDCAPHFDNCDGDGAHGCETALSAGNSRACGACARDCLEGQCANYECSRITVSSQSFNVNDLVSDNAHLYWTAAPDDPGFGDGGCTLAPTGVFKSNPDGGSAGTVIAAQQTDAITFSADGGGIYFMSGRCGIANETLEYVRKDGTCSPSLPCPQLLSKNMTYYTQGLVVDDFHGYWLDVTTNQLHAIPLDGTVAETPIAGGFKAIYGSTLAVDPGGPVWATPAWSGGDGGAYILTLPPGGGGSSGLTQALEATGYPGGVTTDGASIYWTTQDGFVLSAARSGGPQTTLASAQDGPKGIVVDATSVYWFDTGNGAIMRIGKNGKCRTSTNTCPEVLATSGTPRAITLDDNAVYWADHGFIFKVAK